MKISIVAAVARNNVIGHKNKIPWRLPPDLARLKELTLGQVVIVGMNTYESMAEYYDTSGREMPGKIYIILSNSKSYKPKRENALVAHSVEEALKKAEDFHTDEVFVIGGKMVFETFLPETQTIYLTKIDKDFEGDTYFPELNDSEWNVTKKESFVYEKDNLPYGFLVLERV